MDRPTTIAPDGGKPLPRSLFKYRSLAGEARRFAREILVDQRLYFPSPDDLNDPFDCKPYLATEASPAERVRYIRGLVKRMAKPGTSRRDRLQISKEIGGDQQRFFDTMKMSLAQTLSRSGVYSLSERDRDLLMWPHYADNHRGVCLRFDFAALGSEGLIPMPVTYSTERPTGDPICDSLQDLVQNAFLTKGLPWEYEREWRLIMNQGARSILTLKRHTVDGVILGARISDADRAEVLGWVQSARRPVEVMQARFLERSYALEIDMIPQAAS